MKTDPPDSIETPIKSMGGEEGDQYGRLGNDQEYKEEESHHRDKRDSKAFRYIQEHGVHRG